MNCSTLPHHRQQFPALANKVYFNYGGQGAMAQAAMDAIAHSFNHIQQIGPFSNAVYDWIVEEANQTRAAIAHACHVDPNTISLTEDASVGCNIALWGLDWQGGDHLLMSDCEHPGIIAAIQELQRRFDLDVSICPLAQTVNHPDPVAAVIDLVQQHLRPTTRLFVVSHVLWNTGQILPLAEIVQLCHQQTKPVLVLVDAAQSVGMIPLNLATLAVDFYAFTGHKWWCGPEGLGGLYVRPEVRDRLHPTFIGWRNIVSNSQGIPIGWKPNGQRYEIATSAYPLYAGLRQALSIHDSWGTAVTRYHRIQHLSQYLWQRLTELPMVECVQHQPPESGLVSFQLQTATPPSTLHRQLVQTLEEQGIIIRTIPQPPCARACVHYFTLESEIDQLVAAINQWVNHNT